MSQSRAAEEVSTSPQHPATAASQSAACISACIVWDPGLRVYRGEGLGFRVS